MQCYRVVDLDDIGIRYFVNGGPGSSLGTHFTWHSYCGLDDVQVFQFRNISIDLGIIYFQFLLKNEGGRRPVV